VVVANLPLFITDDQIRKELSRFGKFASGFRVSRLSGRCREARCFVPEASVYVSEQQ
jgi:hypothetical protein